MRIGLAFLCLFAFCLSIADDYRTDERLAKTISLRLKVASLSTCVKELNEATGVGIYVAPNIADRKVTVIFKDKPAREAMEMIAKTLFCEWTSDSGGYLLEMPLASQSEELGLLSAEARVLKERVRAAVKQMVDISTRPKEELTEERDRINLELNRLQRLSDPDSKKKVQELWKQYSRYNYLSFWEVGCALRTDPSAADKLAAGETLFASTARGDAMPLPLSAVPNFTAWVVVSGPDGKPVGELRSPTGAIVALRCNPISGNLETRTIATGLGREASGGSRNPIGLLDSGEAENSLGNLSLRKRIRTWARNVDASILAIKLKEPPIPQSPGYLAQAFTIADHLEFLADSAGIGVAADAFRLPASGEQYLNAKTVGEYVRQLQEQTAAQVRYGYVRTERGWLMFKHPRYWRQLAAEIPERQLAPLEGKAAANKPITLDDYAAFADSLTPWQASVFPYRPALTRFPRLPLIQGMPALRIWGALTAEQRQEAYGSGIPVSAMSPAQRNLYILAVKELLWQRYVNETFIPLLMRGVDESNELAFFMRDASNGAQPKGIFDDDEVFQMNGGQPKTRTMESDKAIIARSVVFTLGPAPDSEGSYSILLAPGP